MKNDFRTVYVLNPFEKKREQESYLRMRLEHVGKGKRFDNIKDFDEYYLVNVPNSLLRRELLDNRITDEFSEYFDEKIEKPNISKYIVIALLFMAISSLYIVHLLSYY